MDVKKVLFISQEIDPYLVDTPIGVYSRFLAQGLQEKGAEVRSFMPKYSAINERRNQLHEVIRLSGLNISIDDTDHPLIIKVATLQPTRLQVYFIDNEDYFFRHSTSKQLETVEDAAANDERSMFFVRGVVETVKKLRWNPDIVQCTGWITALIPLYLKKIYGDDPAFTQSKTVFTILADSDKSLLDTRMVEKLAMEGFSPADFEPYTDEEGRLDYLKLNKIAIDFADAVAIGADNVDPELIEYAKASGKPLLPYTADNFAAAYFDFYTSL